MTVTAVDDVGLTISTPFASIPALPSGARVSAHGWDQRIASVTDDRTRLYDFYQKACNTNWLLIESVYNFEFEGRIKNRFHIMKMGNPAFQSNRLIFRISGAGRAEDRWDAIVPSGADTGWTLQLYVDGSLGSAPGAGYFAVVTPAKGKPLVNGKPQWVCTRWLEDAIELWVGNDNRLLRADATGVTAASLKADWAAAPTSTLSVVPATAAGARAAMRQVGDLTGGLQIAGGSAGLDFTTGYGAAGAARQLFVRHLASAAVYADVVGGNAANGAKIVAESSSATDAPLRLGGKGSGPVTFLTPAKAASYTIATKPAASLVGPGAQAWISDAAPANDKRCYVGNDNVWRDAAGTAI